MKNIFKKISNKITELAVKAKTAFEAKKAELYVDKGVGIIGDLPFYVSYNSSDLSFGKEGFFFPGLKKNLFLLYYMAETGKNR